MFKRAPTDTSEAIGRELGRLMNELRDKIKANTPAEIKAFIESARKILRKLDWKLRIFILPGTQESDIWQGRLDGCEGFFAKLEAELDAREGAIDPRELPRNTVVSAYAYFEAVRAGAADTLSLNTPVILKLFIRPMRRIKAFITAILAII